MLCLKSPFLRTLSIGLLLLLFSPASFANWNRDQDYFLTVLHTNDHHGRFWHNEKGEYGLAAQKTVIDRIRQEVAAQGGSLLLISGGDINTGVPESDLQKAEPDFRGMSLIGYDAMALGNHEFDHPIEVLRQQQQWANFPLLSANIYDKNTKLRPFNPYHLFNKQGIKIAVVGLTTNDTPLLANIEHVKAYHFRSPIAEAQQLLPILESTEHPDIIIAATHMGHYDNGEHGTAAPGDVELARSLPYGSLDLIIGGHSQDPVCLLSKNKKQPDYIPGTPCAPDQQNGTWIVQAHEWGKYVGRANFKFRNGQLTLLNYELIPVNLVKEVQPQADGTKKPLYYTEYIPHDNQMLALLTPYQQLGEQSIQGDIGSIDATLNGNREQLRYQQLPIGQLVGKALLAQSNGDLAIFGSGSIRDSLYAGTITYRDVLRVLPFFNTLVSVEMSGAQLLDYLQVVANKSAGSGGFPQYVQLNFQKKGDQLTHVIVNGQPLDKHKSYKLITLSFFSSGGDGYPVINHYASFNNSGYVVSDVVKNYIEKQSPLKIADYQVK